MIRLFLIITFVFCFNIPVFAQNQVLKTSVNKSFIINNLKEKAFEDIKYNKDVSMFKPEDPDYKENQKAIKNGISFIKNRFITYFSDGSYSVDIFENIIFNRYFIYTSNGDLVFICYRQFPKKIKNVNDYFKSMMDNSVFPQKVYKYSYPEGDLINVTYEISVKNQYVFKANGDFFQYWLNDNAYDPEGNLILQRDIKPFTKE